MMYERPDLEELELELEGSFLEELSSADIADGEIENGDYIE